MQRNLSRSGFALQDIDQTIAERFEQQAHLYSDRVAIKSERFALTYDQLNSAANRVARAVLTRVGVGTAPIAVWFRGGAALMIASLATLKAGRPYAPLDTRLPELKARQILAGLDGALLLTDEQNLSTALRLSVDPKKVLNVDALDESLSMENIGLRRSPDTVAYINFTSGTTGEPKGVVWSHRSELFGIRAKTHALHIRADDRISLLRAHNVGAARDMYLALLNGATSVTVDFQETGLAALARWLSKEKITVLSCVATIFRQAVRSAQSSKDFARVRLVHIGGETIFKADVELYKRYFPDHCTFVSRYSLSETPAVSYFFVDKQTEITEERVPVGYPLDGIDVRILDNDGNELGPLRVGEIAVRSRYLALEYWRQPELTRAKFVRVPENSGVRIYRTGDLGYVLPDGCLVHVGRKDFQAKVRGHRVELSAIETALHEIDGVTDAVVVQQSHDDKNGRVIAYVVAADGAALTVKRLRGHLKARLPDFMLPAQFIFLTRLPLNAGGKVDRRALAALSRSSRRAATPPPPARNELEAVLTRLWRDALEVESVGIHDDFTELGGDSLLAAQIVARVSEIFPLTTPLAHLLEAPTVAELAEWLTAHEREPGQAGKIATAVLRSESMSDIEIRAAAGVSSGEGPMTRLRGDGPRSDIVAAKRRLLSQLLRRDGIELPAAKPIRRLAFESGAPLSFAQERLWFLDQLDPGNAVYNISRALRLRGRLYFQALLKAIDAVLQRHDILRTTFRSGTEGPIQDATLKTPVDIPVIDLRRLTGKRRHVRLESLLGEIAGAPFDLTAGPLVRSSFIRLAAADHVLIVVLHQIVCDGWSARRFFHELAVFYQAYVSGNPVRRMKLPIQYQDYALWQRDPLGEEAQGGDLAYWRAQLRDSLSEIQLPFDRARPALPTLRGARLALTLRTSLARLLKRLGAQEGATLFMTLMAAFNVLLQRYSHQEDICVGFPLAQRRRPETQELIGPLVNTLVLRSDLSGNPTFRQLLRRVREQCRSALAHQELPFHKLVDDLARTRDLSRNPLFQVMFAYQRDLAVEFNVAGIESTPLEIPVAASKFDLTLSLSESDRALSGFLEYSSDLFNPSTIDRMARHWKTLLRAIVGDPDRPIAALPLLDRAERRQIVIDWNNTAVDYPRSLRLHELFEAQAEKSPHATALVCGDQRWTYRQLNERANRMAHHLRGFGVGADKLVGVCLERSPEMVIALLAILKAGGAYVPLDPKYPPARIELMLDEARVSMLVSRKRILEDKKRWSIEDGKYRSFRPRSGRASNRDPRLRMVCLDGDAPVIARQSAENPQVRNGSGSLAYVIFTSGSSGQPKGVAIEHRNAVAFLCWARKVFSPQELAGVLASTSICFDLAVFELFAPLSWGGKVILIEDVLALSGGPAAEITLINTVPSALGEVLDSGGLPSPVRTVNLAGEPLREELVRRMEQCGVDKIYDLYGPSETTTYSTFALRAADRKATIGRPIANTKIYLLDDALEPVPIGVAGDLYIGGAGVARGYWRRPELTAENFLPDPFAETCGARMYRTGDLARYRPDGDMEYLGRADRQVKVRGYRIEPGEIEAALISHPAIRECIVVAREDASGASAGKLLVAYVVPAGQASPESDALRNFLRRTMPEFMVPAVFIILASLPRTPNGKVDRHALPPADSERPVWRTVFAPPRTEVEEVIAQEWRAVLKIDRIGIHDNFFDLGGHSLLAARIAGRLRAHLHVDLPLRKLFELPTLAALADHIQDLRRHQSGVAVAPVVPVPRDRKIPLSFAQRRLWFLHQLEPSLMAYNMPELYRIRGAVDVSALEAALRAMIARHESLRTCFVEIDGVPVQKIMPAVRFTLTVLDRRDRPAGEAQAQAERWITADARQPYALDKAPLMRAKLLWVDETEFVLLLNFHHAVADAASLVIFYRELAQLYRAMASNTPADLPPLSLQYADFAAWQQDRLSGPTESAHLNYWKTQLAALPAPLDLPTDFVRPAEQSYFGAKRKRRLSKDLSARLKVLGRKEGATLFMTLLAALKVLLARLSGQRDIVVGSTSAGRTRPELDGVIGFFINALALRTDLSGNPTFVQLLRRVREVCLGAYTHQDLPFEQVVEALNPARDPARNPIFQVLFNWADRADRQLDLAGCETVRLEAAMPGAKFDLVVQAPEIDNAIELVFIYNADLFSEQRILTMLDQLESLLAQVVAEPDQAIHRYSLVAGGAKAVLPAPAAKLSDAWPGSLSDVIAGQVRHQPLALALADDLETWSYGELERCSNRLARRLNAAGIGTRDVVALYAHRDATLAAALLGVLKAGAVFVMLDPQYPPMRLAAYLRIARPKAWLQMTGAGEPPEELVHHLDAAGVRFRLSLPRKKAALLRSLDGFADSAPPLSLGPDDPAYVAFTSGSTGEPKGVLCRHGSMTHFLSWLEMEFALTRADRYALLSGLAYNHLHRDLFTGLTSGAAIYVPATESLKEPWALVRWLDKMQITVLHLTPAFGRLLCTAAGQALPSLRRIFFGGDILLRQDARDVHELAPNAEILSLYGATETQRAVGYFRITDQVTRDERAKPTLPTGRGAPDVQLLLLTVDGALAGVGEVGELFVRSPHLAAGYIGDDALTAANFVINPFTGGQGDRLYRSGELGRYLPDGNVEWVGRIDRRVSIRGFRVELAEVEAMLSRCPGVRQAAVIAREFPTGDDAQITDTRLCAYFEGESLVSVDAVRGFAADRLPHYMVPAYFHKLDRLPLNPNGKIDHFSLPEPRLFNHSCENNFEAPRNEIEQKLSAIFARALGVEHIGRRDNFFELGGHSLLAAQIAARIRETLRVELDLRAFLEAPTLEALSRRVETMRASSIALQIEREEIEL